MLAVELVVPRREFAVEVAFDVGPGERLALFGPSGGGKSTVLEAVAGLVRPSSGRVSVDGTVLTAAGGAKPVHVPPWRRGVALLRQDPALFPHRSVGDNIDWGGRWADRARREHLVDALGLRQLLGARPRDLSGGQAQRVALVRALSVRRPALLLDEPYTGLDIRLRRQLTDLVTEAVVEDGAAAVLVAHELEEAQAFADRIGVLDRGALLQVAAPHEVVRRPASRRVAELVGYGGFVTAGDALAGVHPDRVVAGSEPERGLVLSGTVSRCRPREARWELDLAGPWGELPVRLPDPVPPGRAVTVTALDPPWFAAAGGPAPPAAHAVGGDGRWP